MRIQGVKLARYSIKGGSNSCSKIRVRHCARRHSSPFAVQYERRSNARDASHCRKGSHAWNCSEGPAAYLYNLRIPPASLPRSPNRIKDYDRADLPVRQPSAKRHRQNPPVLDDTPADKSCKCNESARLIDATGLKSLAATDLSRLAPSIGASLPVKRKLESNHVSCAIGSLFMSSSSCIRLAVSMCLQLYG